MDESIHYVIHSTRYVIRGDEKHSAWKYSSWFSSGAYLTLEKVSLQLHNNDAFSVHMHGAELAAEGMEGSLSAAYDEAPYPVLASCYGRRDAPQSRNMIPTMKIWYKSLSIHSKPVQ